MEGRAAVVSGAHRTHLPPVLEVLQEAVRSGLGALDVQSMPLSCSHH